MWYLCYFAYCRLILKNFNKITMKNKMKKEKSNYSYSTTSRITSSPHYLYLLYRASTYRHLLLRVGTTHDPKLSHLQPAPLLCRHLPTIRILDIWQRTSIPSLPQGRSQQHSLGTWQQPSDILPAMDVQQLWHSWESVAKWSHRSRIFWTAQSNWWDGINSLTSDLIKVWSMFCFFTRLSSTTTTCSRNGSSLMMFK